MVKLDTYEDRYDTVVKLLTRAKKNENSFHRDGVELNLYDGLFMVMSVEKLLTVAADINTERFIETSFLVIDRFDCNDKEVWNKFFALFAAQRRIFFEEILIKRIDSILELSKSYPANRKLIKFKKELLETMTMMRERYEEICKVDGGNKNLITLSPKEYTIVSKLILRGKKLEGLLISEINDIEISDLIFLTMIMERLYNLDGLTYTEQIFNDTYDEMCEVQGASDDEQDYFLACLEDQTEVFIEKVLLEQIECVLNFTNMDFEDRRLINFQKEVRKNMITMRKQYKEAYGI